MTFSVITCTYNAEAVLKRTLDSVRKQTCSHVEHLIIDGASTDNTCAIAKEYEAGEHVHRVRVISEKDRGLYDAMNKGMSLATGDYIVFLNAGDEFYDENTLGDIAARLGDDAYGVIYGNTEIVDDKGKSLGMRRLQPPKKLTWKSFRDGMLVCHQSFYANTDIAKRTPYDLKYKLSADVDWCIRILKESERMGLTTLNMKKTLCRYLEGGMSVKSHRTSLMERFSIMRRHYGLISTIYKHITFLFR